MVVQKHSSFPIKSKSLQTRSKKFAQELLLLRFFLFANPTLAIMFISKTTLAILSAATMVASAETLPPIKDLIELAFPTWCIDENEVRLPDLDVCADGTPNGLFSPLYFTKQYSGADPALGGYPTNIDIHYAFEFAAPYFGQACAGSPHMCPENFDGSATNCKQCPKLKTEDDNGPYGPGHVPPHISLAAASKAYEMGEGGDVSTWFDFDANACRILPNVLLSLIRLYYQREADGSVYYPPPFSDLGGAYPLEFVNLAGASCEAEKLKHPDAGDLDCFEDHSGDVSLYPDYLKVGHGSPHYCDTASKDADVNPDYCPYIFFGPNRGKYRHPHIAFSAVEVYLSNMVMPEKCGTAWDDSKYPAAPDTTVAFPYMTDFPPLANGLEAPQQPLMEDGMWVWPGPEGTKKKPVAGNFANELVIVEDLTCVAYETATPPPMSVKSSKKTTKSDKKSKKTKKRL